MTLQEYVEKKDITLYELAKQMGYSKTYFYPIASGKKPMTAKLARKLHNHTGGELDLRKTF